MRRSRARARCSTSARSFGATGGASSASARRARRWRRTSPCGRWSGRSASSRACPNETTISWRPPSKLLRESPARTPSLQEVALADAALVLGEDVPNIAPMLAFALRQVILQGEIRTPRRWASRAGTTPPSATRPRASRPCPSRKRRCSSPRRRETRLGDIAARTSPRLAGRCGAAGIRGRARDQPGFARGRGSSGGSSQRWPTRSPERSCARSGRSSSPARVAAARR